MALSIKNLPDRNHLPLLLNEMGLIGSGVELGVAAGKYSRILLKKSELKQLYGIDMWADRKHNKKEYLRVKRIAERYGNRYRIIRERFSAAKYRFEDEFFDFIFVDGYAAKGNRNGDTMKEWWPKLKPGGIMAVHDYTKLFPANIKAINRFAKKQKLKGYTTTNENKPCWMTLKNISLN